MTGEQTSTREKLGSVVFAFLMITSMVAVGGAAFAGNAAATTQAIGGGTAEDVTIGQSSTTHTVTLTGVDDSGDGGSITIPTSNLPSSVSVTGVSANSDTLPDVDITDAQLALNGEDIQITIPDAGGTNQVGEIKLDVTYDTSSQSTITSQTITATGASQGTADITFNFVVGALAGGSNSYVSYEIGTSTSEDVITGSADQELSQVRVKDVSGGEFAGDVSLYLPPGVKVNESASNLNSNTVTTRDGTVTIDSVTVENSSNNIVFDVSGSSNAGETIRIKSGALHVETDGSQYDTSSASTGLPVEIRHWSGTFDTSADGDNTAMLQAQQPVANNPSGQEALNINTDGQILDDNLKITDIDQYEVGADTDLVLTVDGSGVTFDQSVDLTTVIGNDDGTEGDFDVDGDGTNELDVDNASITDTTLTVPVNNTITDNTGFPQQIAFRTDDGDAGEGVRFNTTGSASGAADLNVSVESAAPSTGSYQLGAVDSPTFDDRINQINSPTLEFNTAGNDDGNFAVAAGADSQDVDPAGDADLVVDTTTASVAGDQWINITLNNSNVEFDGSVSDSTDPVNDNYLASGAGDDDINQILVTKDKLALEVDSTGIPQGENVQLTETVLKTNVSADAADDEYAQFNATVGGVLELSDSTDVLRVERPDLSLNNGANATVNVDNDGEQDEIDPGAGQALTVTSDDINGQISDATNVTITLESDTGVTFDKSAATATNANAGGNGDFTIYGADTTDLATSDNKLGGSGTVNAVTVNDQAIEIELNDDGGNDGPTTSLASDEAIVIDELFVNATADATNTTVSATTNTSDAEVTSDFAEIVVTNEVAPTALQADADISSAGFGADGTDVTEDPAQSVTETVTGAVKVQDSTDANFGGADVNLEIVETPDDSSGASLNASTVTTGSNGEAQFNFTAGDTSGDYVVNASIAGQSGASSALNITYAVQSGGVDSVSIEPIEDAISPRGAGTDAGTAALWINATDAQGNAVDSGQLSVDLTVDSADASVEGVYESVDSDTTSGVGQDGTDPSLSGNTLTTDNDGNTAIVLSDTTAEDVTVSAEYQGNTDSGTVTFYDNIGQVNVDLNRSDVRTGQQVQVNATLAQSDSTTITVPDLDVDFDDNSGANTSFESPSVADNAVSASTNGDGVAQAVVEADAEGTSKIDAASNLKSGSATLTVDDPDYGISDVSLDPNTVTANTTVDHDLSYTVNAASNDGNSDTYTVTLPNAASFESENSLTVTDANGDEISLGTSASFADANNGSNNQLTFGIQPDSNFDTTAVTVDANVTVSFDDVSETTTAPITLDVEDSTQGDTSAQTNVTIEADGDTDSPLDGTAGEYDNDGDGTVTAAELGDAVNAFGQGNLTAAELGDVVNAFGQS